MRPLRRQPRARGAQEEEERVTRQNLQEIGLIEVEELGHRKARMAKLAELQDARRLGREEDKDENEIQQIELHSAARETAGSEGETAAFRTPAEDDPRGRARDEKEPLRRRNETEERLQVQRLRPEVGEDHLEETETAQEIEPLVAPLAGGDSRIGVRPGSQRQAPRRCQFQESAGGGRRKTPLSPLTIPCSRARRPMSLRRIFAGH